MPAMGIGQVLALLSTKSYKITQADTSDGCNDVDS